MKWTFSIFASLLIVAAVYFLTQDQMTYEQLATKISEVVNPPEVKKETEAPAKAQEVIAEADFYIAPDGDDKNTGTFTAPFASLQRAKDAVRELKKTNSGNIRVLLRGGRYEFSETLVFSLDDSGSADGTITYAAYPGETPILSAGNEITNLQLAQTEIEGLPTQAQGNVLVADVTADFRTLYDAEGILPRASSKGFITREGGGRNKILIPKDALKNWSNVEGLEVMVRPHHAWIRNVLPVTKLDYKKATIETSIDASYVTNPLHFLKDTPNCWVENSIEELDEPGEWVLNPTEGKLYLWPRNDTNVYHPQLNEIIRVEGDIDFKGPEDTPVTNLTFDGLTFMHGERYTLTKDDAGLQHDWDMLDKDNALVRFRGTEQCAIKNSHFLHSGSGAIRVDLHGMLNEISGNHIEHLGGGGILLCGYGPGTKDVNRKNFVSNNHIHHVGEIYWHSPGLFIWQSGENQISNNFIHHTNYTGLILSGCMIDFFQKRGRELGRTLRLHEIGNTKQIKTDEDAIPFWHSHDNIIEYNEISHSMQKLGDGNAIYIRGAGPNNIIRRNYVHHLVTPMIMQCAIRTDGGQRGTIINENIIYKCTSQGMMLKLDTTFENNIIADVIYPPRGYYLSLREGPLTGASIKHNIFYSTSSVDDFINELDGKRAGGTEDRRGRAVARVQDADTGANLFYSAATPELAQAAVAELESLGTGKGSIAADPMFVDPANGNFQLQPDSPALKMGFKPIDQSKIGLLK
ncbi:right-handed parallel beta-helix repeat-containing protein [Rubritalea sp.]|uniref:right-handed parallel beta-helix repeat-containing protein n=1 Tax=Rubritalea sp. TaxID=2109375 RepID=UPI003EF9A885